MITAVDDPAEVQTLLPLIIYYAHASPQVDMKITCMPSGLSPYDFPSSLNLSLSFDPTARLSTAMDLPFEIWLHIASFLSTDQLQRMCIVNRIFYGIAMMEKYKVVDFCKDARTIPGTLASLK